MDKLIRNNVIKLDYRNLLKLYLRNFENQEIKEVSDEELYEHFVINHLTYTKPEGCLPSSYLSVEQFYLKGINIFEIIEYVNIGEKLFKPQMLIEEDKAEKETKKDRKRSTKKKGNAVDFDIYTSSESDFDDVMEKNSNKNTHIEKNEKKKNPEFNKFRRVYRFLLSDGKYFIYAYEDEYNEQFNYLQDKKHQYPKILVYNQPLIKRGVLFLKKHQSIILFKGSRREPNEHLEEDAEENFEWKNHIENHYNINENYVTGPPMGIQERSYAGNRKIEDYLNKQPRENINFQENSKYYNANKNTNFFNDNVIDLLDKNDEIEDVDYTEEPQAEREYLASSKNTNNVYSYEPSLQKQKNENKESNNNNNNNNKMNSSSYYNSYNNTHERNYQCNNAVLEIPNKNQTLYHNLTNFKRKSIDEIEDEKEKENLHRKQNEIVTTNTEIIINDNTNMNKKIHSTKPTKQKSQQQINENVTPKPKNETEFIDLTDDFFESAFFTKPYNSSNKGDKEEMIILD